MKLQIKDAGAWRNLASYTAATEQAVLAAAAELLRALDQPRTAMRVAEGGSATMFCQAPDFKWAET